MHRKFVLTFLLILPFFTNLFSQTYSISNRLPVRVNGNPVRNAWAGGINAGQFMPFDLDRDGIKDLVVFDRQDFSINTYLNYGSNGSIDYEFAPEYIKSFPDTCVGWMTLYDYNNDGFEDCFCGTPTSRILVFKNKGNAQNIEFELVEAPLSSYYGQNYLWVYAARNDYQAFDDVDLDGDMDFLVFEILGSRVEFHKNMAVENGHSLDSLEFEVYSQCHGNFIEDPANCTAYLDQSTFPCMGSQIIDPDLDLFDTETTRHAGSTLLSLNLNGDTLQDLIVGDIDCPDLYALYNGGTRQDAHFDSLQNDFPIYDVPVNIELHPASFYLDVDNDGKKDLICAPNRMDNVRNADGVTFHKNAGSNNNPDFEFQGAGFLQNDMIEMGSGAAPAFFDYDGDGLQDMLVGNFGYFQGPGNYETGLSLYLNKGSDFYPILELYDDDFLRLRSDTTLDHLTPAFGDPDGDGDMDLVFGDENGLIHYYENQAANPGDTAVLVSTASSALDTIDVGIFSAPQWIDIDQDNDFDLIVGNGAGKIFYYENIGSPTVLDIELLMQDWGGIDLEGPFSNGNAKPFVIDYDDDGIDELLLGTLSGWVEIYEDLTVVPGDTFTYFGNLADFDFGSNSAPYATVLDTGNGLRYFVGNERGGIYTYDKAPDFVGREAEATAPSPVMASLFPNPTRNKVNWRLDRGTHIGRVDLQVVDMMGKTHLNQDAIRAEGVLNVEHLAPGVYWVVFSGIDFREVRKLVIQ